MEACQQSLIVVFAKLLHCKAHVALNRACRKNDNAVLPSLSLLQVWPPLLAKDGQRQVSAEARGEDVVLVASPANSQPTDTR